MPHRIYQTPKVIDRKVSLRDYDGEVRQLFITDLGHEEATILLTNDLKSSAKKRITRYAQRMLIENGLADSVDFFHLDSLSSAIRIKVDFDEHDYGGSRLPQHRYSELETHILIVPADTCFPFIERKSPCRYPVVSLAPETDPSMRHTLQVLNELESAGVLSRYAIGGAMGATFYVEPALTFDLDVFVELPEFTSGLLSLAPLYDALRGRGYTEEGECVVIEGVPVQFLPVYNLLLEEALAEAREILYEGNPNTGTES